MNRERLVELHPVPVGDRRFALAVASSALFELRDDVARALEVHGAGAAAALDAGALDALRELQLLVPVDATEPRLRDPSPRDDTVATLVLELAGDCNLACDYCYAHPTAAPRRMSPATAARAVDFLFDHLPAAGPAGITLFGGEPLLNAPALTAAVERALDWGAATGRGVRFGLTTNGTVVGEAAVDLLAAVGARVTVSLDGDRDRHDRHRRDHRGRGSYDRAVAGLRSLQARCDVTVRATAGGPDPDPEAICDHLWSLGVERVGVATADVPPGGPGALDEGGLARLWRGMEALAARYRAEALEGRHLGFTNLDGLLRTVHRGVNRDHPCGAGLRLLACDVDGGLHTCHRLLGAPGHRVGDLAKGFAPERRALVDGLSLGARPGCAGCWARYLCGGGCHHAHHVAGATSGGDPLPVCRWLRRWMHTGLALYAELSLRRPGFLQEFIDPIPACPVE